MNFFGRFGVRSVTETKNLTTFLVHPLFVELDAVFVLDRNVFVMRVSNILRTHAARDVVDIHVSRHTRAVL